MGKIEPETLIRLCKASLAAAMALLLGLVAFNNITDYGDNWTFVQHVMAMDTVFPDSTQRWRAIHSVPVQQLFYLAIIATEALSGGLLMLGAVALFRQARSESSFDRAACAAGRWAHRRDAPLRRRLQALSAANGS